MSILLTIVTILSTGIVPGDLQTPRTTRAKVDLVELNHFLDDSGREVFRQLVFYDWCRQQSRFHVRAWRLIKHPSQLPKRSWEPQGYLMRWQDKSVTREVWAKSLRETWTQEDPERVNRAILPENERRPLWEPPAKVSQTQTTRR